MPAIGAPGAMVLLLTLAMVVLPIPCILCWYVLHLQYRTRYGCVTGVGLHTWRPLDFAAFQLSFWLQPARLALNVASTRVVLPHGHEGGDAAGNVIEAFGNVVIGGNLRGWFSGVFWSWWSSTLAVVTKGAGRISEVSARFTFDALPGKQMAIDAVIWMRVWSIKIRRCPRRFEVTKEADFYGSMDGASKFVKGDAIAGILIPFINIIAAWVSVWLNLVCSWVRLSKSTPYWLSVMVWLHKFHLYYCRSLQRWW